MRLDPCVRRGAPRGRAALILGLVGATLAGCGGCGSKKDEGPITAPPPPGAASNDALTTGLGLARGLDSNLAPTSTQWRRIVVSDDKHALLAGEVGGHAVAITTADAGRTWRGYDVEAGAWTGWAVGPDGAIALATGTRAAPKSALAPGALAPIDAARLYFPLDDGTVGAASQLFPAPPALVNARVAVGAAAPFVLGKDLAAFIVEDGPRQPKLVYGGPPGAAPGDPSPLPSGERFVSTPYGRPAMMLSTVGSSLVARAVQPPGKPLDVPRKIVGLRGTPTLAAELAAGPGCEGGEWSFQRVAQGPTKTTLLGVSAARIVAFPLPDTTVRTGAFGCVAEKGGAERVVVETLDPKTKAASLSVCDLEGKCAPAQNPPFRSWPELHQQSVAAIVTARGVVTALSSRAGDRWGLYLSESTDGGGVYEIQRAVGEGTGDRGRIELGAMLSFGRRALLLVSADVTGTSRRGWYVTVSDDDGVSWGPP